MLKIFGFVVFFVLVMILGEGLLQYLFIFFRCYIVNQFNEGLYDIIIVFDENLLMDLKIKLLDFEKKKDKK